MHLLYPVVLGALLFAIGVYAVLARRNAVLVLMGIELLLNAVNLELVAFDAWFRDLLHAGQVFALFVVCLAAAEVGLGLAIVLTVFRTREGIGIDEQRALSEQTPSYDARPAEPPERDPVEA
jgi:NADH-quinone oxidoreductase subunit K